MKGTSARQRAFIEHYLAHWNATEAARLAGYSQKTAYSQGARLLKNVEVQAAVAARLGELQATADEVKLRLTSHARGTMADFLIGSRLSIDQARERGQLHLIKKYKVTRRIDPKRGEEDPDVIETVEVELYDAQAAMVQIGRVLGLFVDRTEHTGKDGGPIDVRDLEAVRQKRWAAAGAALAAADSEDESPASG